MSLFYSAREKQDCIDQPHVSIKVWLWCPAWCDCDFSYKKIKKNIVYDHVLIKKNLAYVASKFSDDFEIFLVWLNILKYEKLVYLLDEIIAKGRKFKLQIPHNLDENDIKTLTELWQQYGRFNCSIPKTIDHRADLENLMKEINFLSKIEWLWKIYFDVFLDVHTYEKIISYIIKKLWTNRSNNSLNCIIWDRFDIKFHDLSWKLNHTNKCVDNLDKTSCLMQNYFYIKDEKIYLYDHIELWINSDLTFHDNLCYLWNFAVSNIWFEDTNIVNDFKKYRSYLDHISDGDLKIQCYKCIKNSYNYSKTLDHYTY